MTEIETVRATAPRTGIQGASRVTFTPSPELLALLEANPGGELRFGRSSGTPPDGQETSQTVPGMVGRNEHATNHGCPHCGADFSITCADDSPAETREMNVSCPSCAGAVLVPVPMNVEPAEVEVGPAWDALPARRIRDRVKALMGEERDLSARHAERMARLEDELAKAREEARTDAVTGLLNERAHIADRAGPAHGVMHFPLVETVYDRCGQTSGNQIAHDAARLLRATAKDRVRVYRIGTAKFALIGDDGETVQRVLAELDAEMKAVSITAPLDGEGAPKGAASVDEFIARHPKPYGLAVRMHAARRP